MGQRCHSPAAERPQGVTTFRGSRALNIAVLKPMNLPMKHAGRILCLLLVLTGPAFADESGSDGERCNNSDDEGLRPLPSKIDLDSAKVSLGGSLFKDRRLSKDETIACSSCHDLARAGQDGRPRSIGVGGSIGA